MSQNYGDLVEIARRLLRVESECNRIQSRRGADIDVVNLYKMMKGISRNWFERQFSGSGFNRADVFRDARAKLTA